MILLGVGKDKGMAKAWRASRWFTPAQLHASSIPGPITGQDFCPHACMQPPGPRWNVTSRVAGAGLQSAHVARCLGIMLLDPAMRNLIPAEDLALELLPALRTAAERCTAQIQVPLLYRVSPPSHPQPDGSHVAARLEIEL